MPKVFTLSAFFFRSYFPTSISLINVGNGFHCLRSFFLLFQIQQAPGIGWWLPAPVAALWSLRGTYTSCVLFLFFSVSSLTHAPGIGWWPPALVAALWSLRGTNTSCVLFLFFSVSSLPHAPGIGWWMPAPVAALWSLHGTYTICVLFLFFSLFFTTSTWNRMMAACTSCSTVVFAWDVHYLRSLSILFSFLYHKHLESDDGRLHQLQHCGLCMGHTLSAFSFYSFLFSLPQAPGIGWWPPAPVAALWSLHGTYTICVLFL